MTKNALTLAAAALLFPSGVASAQNQTPPQYDSSGAPVPPGSTVTPRPNTGNTPNDPPAGTSGQAPRDERLPAARDPDATPLPVAPLPLPLPTHRADNRDLFEKLRFCPQQFGEGSTNTFFRSLLVKPTIASSQVSRLRRARRVWPRLSADGRDHRGRNRCLR